jgi:hypothetical protein
MTNRLEQAVGLGEEIERQVGLDSAWVCALTCSTGTWRGTTWPRRSLTPGGGSPACMSMTTRRRPYREVGQFGQVVGVVSPQPSTGARSTGGDIRNDKLQQLHLGHGHHVASLDVLIEPFTSRTYAVATLIFSSVACSYTTPWDAT